METDDIENADSGAKLPSGYKKITALVPTDEKKKLDSKAKATARQLRYMERKKSAGVVPITVKVNEAQKEAIQKFLKTGTKPVVERPKLPRGDELEHRIARVLAAGGWRASLIRWLAR